MIKCSDQIFEEAKDRGVQSLSSSLDDVNFKDAALIVWDMQNGIAKRASNFEEIVRNSRQLIDAAHAAHTPVIYSQHTGLPRVSFKVLDLVLQKEGY